MDGLEEARDPCEDKSRLSRIWNPERSTPSSAVTVNVLCLIGVVIGICAVFLPWLWTSVDALQTHYSLAEFLAEAHPSAETSGLFLGGCIFIIGTGLAVVLPVGSILQAFGLLWFLSSELDRETRIADSWYSGIIDGGMSYGFYIGMLSLVIVVASLVRPSGPGFPVASGWRAGRMSTSTKSTTKKGEGVLVSIASISEISAALRPQKRWTAALVAVCLLSGGLAFVATESPTLNSVELVREVQGGVEFRLLEVGVGILSAGWDNFTILMHDDSETVNWSHQSIEGFETTEEGGTLYVLSTRDLSGIRLRLEVLDFGGEGRWSAGDVVTILLEDDTVDFVEGATYDIGMYPPPPMALDVGYVHVDVFFSFTDGHLNSDGAVDMTYGFTAPDDDYGPQIAVILLLVTTALAVALSLILKALCGRRPADR